MTQQWKPIESAPKDELILVGPTKRMGICVAMNHSQDGWVTETCNEWCSIYTPTHWMPLPAEPSKYEGDHDGMEDDPRTQWQQPATPPASAQDAKTDDTAVICPGCAHQFRAIPVQVQGLLTRAGYEPPFLDASAQDDAKDAARWRFIRRKLCLTGNGDGTCGMHAINLPASIPGWPEPGAAVAEFCDAAIDEAIAASQQQEG